jgi:hypothetical protein
VECCAFRLASYITFLPGGGGGRGGRGVSKHRRKREGQGKRGWKTEVSETIVNKEKV